jgi:hypothetical protein
MRRHKLSPTLLRSLVAAGLSACLPDLVTAQPINLLPPGPGAANTAQPLVPLAVPIPAPSQPAAGAARAHLATARGAYLSGRIAEAQKALERTETDLMNQPPGSAGNRPPATQRALLDIGVAQQALGRRDRQGVLLAINDAVTAMTLAARMPPPPVAAAAVPAAGTPPGPPPPPPATYALLPGHWELHGWKYVWVPPENLPRRVEYRPFVLGHYVWRDRRWTWVPSHYASN